MLKILHVVSDDKFIDRHLGRYANCENEIVYLKNEFTYTGRYLDTIKFIQPASPEYNNVIKGSSQFDFVIVYYLNYDKALLVNSINQKIKVIWHFFGAEIYHMKKYKYDIYSSYTRKVLGIKGVALKKININYYETKANIKDFLTGRVRNTREKVIERAMKRVNFFLGFDENEHKFLKKKVSYLPEFLPLPLTMKVPEVNLNEKKDLRIVVGNSRSPSNNHFDILKLLKRADSKFSILIPYNYFTDTEKYNSRLKEYIKSISNPVELLEEFIPFQEYAEMIGKCSTGIFNSYRQMALGNILISVINGVKVYLSERNSSYEWLKSKGFYVYSIERELEKDLVKGNLLLPQEYSEHNRSVYRKLNNQSINIAFIRSLNKIAIENANTY